MGERKEAWMRIVVGIVSGIVLGVWKTFVVLLGIINFFIAIFSGKRNQELAKMCEIWNTQQYIFVRYMVFLTNQRPFPFQSLKENLSKFGK